MRSLRALPWRAVGAVLLAGCAATPGQRTRPQPDASSGTFAPALAARWQQASEADTAPADAATLAQWWRGLNDPVLSGLVDDALAANEDLQMAQAALRRARALRDITVAGLGPQVGSSASVGRSRSGGSTSGSVAAGLDASWEPDLFGAAADARAAAEAQAAGSAASAAATRIAVVGEVALAYLQWQGTRRQIGIAGQNLAVQRDSLQVAQWRAGAGLATVLDVEQAAGNVEQTQARVAGLQTTQAQTEHQIALLLGQPPGSVRARLATAAAAPAMPELPALGLPADLLRRRPDVLAAEWSVTQALATLSQREAERKPQFSISGRLGWQALSLAALSGGNAMVASLAASVNWPVFDGGAARAQVAAQAAALDSARASYRSAVLTAQRDVEDTLVALVNGRRQADGLRRAAASAQQVLQLTQLRYRSGGVDFGALLDAQRSALSADDSLASAEVELALNQVRLYKALGGGWTAADPSR